MSNQHAREHRSTERTEETSARSTEIEEPYEPTNINVGPRIAALRMRSLPSSGGGRCEIRIVEFEDLMIR